MVSTGRYRPLITVVMMHDWASFQRRQHRPIELLVVRAQVEAGHISLPMSPGTVRCDAFVVTSASLVLSHGQERWAEQMRKLLGDGALYALATVAPILTVLAVTPVVTNILGAIGYGQVAVAISVYQVASVFVAFGLPAVITRDALLEDSGFPGASGQIFMGALLAVAGTAIAGITTSFWSPYVFPDVPMVLIALSLTAGAGLAIVTLAQGLVRAAERVLTFVFIAGTAALLPPVLGLLAVFVVEASAVAYVAGLAAGYGVAALVAVAVALRIARPKFDIIDLLRALRVGLPTIPHGLAVPALLTTVIAFVVQTEGLGLAGTLQISVMLGSAVVTTLNAVNNAWAPMIFRTTRALRPRALADTTLLVAALTLVLVTGFALTSPILVPLIGGPSSDGMLAIAVANIVAMSGAFTTLYLANIHLTFIAGKTWPLAVLTPLAAGLSIMVGLTIANSTGATLLGWATVWPVFYLLQMSNSYFLARIGPFAPVDIRAAIPLTTLTVVVGVGSVVVNSWVANIVIVSAALVVGGAWLQIVRRLRARA